MSTAEQEVARVDHPVVGLWQVELDIDGKQTYVTHTYHPDGIMHLDAGEHGACLIWEPSGDREFRFRGTRPVEPDLYRFLGWQYSAGNGEVSEDGRTFSGSEETDGPRADGRRTVRHMLLRATRLAFD